jgi:DNA-binding PadR family transcriptional regulator
MEKEIFEDMRKALVKHFLDTIILETLKLQSPLSGYDFMEIVNVRFSFMISSGTIYSVLYHLERDGLLKGEISDGRRAYSLTEKGQEAIDCILQSKKEIVGFVQTILKS